MEKINHLESIGELHNEYFVLRHGQSKPNILEIVLSHPEDGKKEEYTLTPEGEEQVRVSVGKAKAEGILGDDTIIYSSPFSRAKKTAEIAKEILGVRDEVIFNDRLRERWFGDWEKTHSSNYQKVWDTDKNNSKHKEANVESAEEVQKRVIVLVEELEKKYEGKKILMVSHGDTLQILQTGFHKKSPAAHRELKHLETAEVRKMELK
jgi:probable phosphoglycerate mutase